MTALLNSARLALDDFAEVARLSSLRFQENRIKIELLAKPHKPGGLPSGCMAVYCFFLGERALKVGIAGPNSDARYRSQHYNPNSAGSTLARSLLTYPEKAGIAPIRSNFVGDWIKRQTDRVNFLIPADFEKGVLMQLESFLHARWKPIYEGRQ